MALLLLCDTEAGANPQWNRHPQQSGMDVWGGQVLHGNLAMAKERVGGWAANLVFQETLWVECSAL